jgi:EAL domain-containing protein (putative c-di-GMP-specific phosphodiesterase class I)
LNQTAKAVVRREVSRIIDNDLDAKVFSTCLNDIKGLWVNLGINKEGVETEQELNTLNNIGIHLIQGFCTAKPLTIEQVIEQYS